MRLSSGNDAGSARIRTAPTTIASRSIVAARPNRVARSRDARSRRGRIREHAHAEREQEHVAREISKPRDTAARSKPPRRAAWPCRAPSPRREAHHEPEPTRQLERRRVTPSSASSSVASPTYVGSSVIGACRMVGKQEREHLWPGQRRPDESLEREPFAAHDEPTLPRSSGNALTAESRIPSTNIAAVARGPAVIAIRFATVAVRLDQQSDQRI